MMTENQIIEYIDKKVLAYFDGDEEKRKSWVQLPNPMLGNVSPMDMVVMGRLRRLKKFVDEQMRSKYLR